MAVLTGFFESHPPQSLGIAVSGGSDSLALLMLALDWARARDVSVFAATVDHGLRPEAKAEAQHVADICRDHGIQHDILAWQGWDGQGNLQAAARIARYRLLAEWAQTRDIDGVAIGHTMDDVAETFLLRLSRKSGVDGLAAMQPAFDRHGQRFVRPLLGVSRDDLRSFLKASDVTWCDDPSNEDLKFDRVRSRKALEHLAPLGIDVASLASVSQNLASARKALQAFAVHAAQDVSVQDRGDLIVTRKAFLDLPMETYRRLLKEALLWISPADYAPRQEALTALHLAISERRTMTLAGCVMTCGDHRFRLTREAKAVEGVISDRPSWDRWQLNGPWRDGMEIRVLDGTTLASIADWRDCGMPRQSLLASPAVWHQENLVAAPLAGLSNGWTADLLPEHAFFPLLYE
ncbi:tRNA lysidine(34) synthetase TilS [uncultured Shimia sp.]|uniref:tRNA lysidine(34) synthetase TilS n=1 Tax=uncultured Shimia sp. TaxID=573152 RepID=UPI00344176D6